VGFSGQVEPQFAPPPENVFARLRHFFAAHVIDFRLAQPAAQVAAQAVRCARFADHPSRLQHRDALMAACEAKLAARPSSEWVEILNAAGLPCGPIYSMDEVFADPQVKHLRMTEVVEHPRDGKLALVRLPLTFSDTPASIRGAAPVPGGDTRGVLAEYGFGDSEIDGLLESGAVGPATTSPGWPTR